MTEPAPTSPLTCTHRKQGRVTTHPTDRVAVGEVHRQALVCWRSECIEQAKAWAVATGGSDPVYVPDARRPWTGRKQNWRDRR